MKIDFSRESLPYLYDELASVPISVRNTALFLIEKGMRLSSVISDYTGAPRTMKNGHSHAAARAVDLVVHDRPPAYAVGLHSKPRFIAFVASSLKPLGLLCSVVVESDHIHLDDTRPPGVYTYTSTTPVDCSCNATTSLVPELVLRYDERFNLVSADFSQVMLDTFKSAKASF